MIGFNFVKREFNVQNTTKNLGTSALISILFSGFLSVLVKICGLIKEVVIANYFGVSSFVDFYVFAIVMVSFFVGPISGSFALLLTQKFISTVQTSFTLASQLYVQTLVLNIFIFSIILGFTFSIFYFSNSIEIVFSEQFVIEQFYTILILPLGILSAVSVINSSILNAQKKFVSTTLLPAVIPFSIVFSVVLNLYEDYFISLLVGTFLGYAIEAALSLILNRKLLLSAKSSFFNLSRNFSELVSKNFPLMFFAQLVMSGCLVIDQVMAFLAGPGSVSIINYGNRVPLGMISIFSIVWIVLFPIFSELVSKGKHLELKKLYVRFASLFFTAILIFSVFIYTYTEDLTTALFKRGEFTSSDVFLVSEVQGIYFFHIPFYLVCVLSMRVAHSYEQQKIVLLCNSVTLMLNGMFNIIFIQFFGVLGVAYATLLSYACMTPVWVFICMRLILSRNSRNHPHI